MPCSKSPVTTRDDHGESHCKYRHCVGRLLHFDRSCNWRGHYPVLLCRGGSVVTQAQTVTPPGTDGSLLYPGPILKTTCSGPGCCQRLATKSRRQRGTEGPRACSQGRFLFNALSGATTSEIVILWPRERLRSLRSEPWLFALE